MKKNVTYIDAVKFETIIKSSGLPFVLQAGFVKVQGPKGRNLYVAATKRVGRVDISGFTVDATSPTAFGFITDLGELEFGNVKQQMDFSRTEDEILATFELLLNHMKTLDPVEKAQRKASAPKAPVAVGWSADIPKAPVMTAEERAERMARLKAAKKNASSQPTA
jgi:hypothetical protein